MNENGERSPGLRLLVLSLSMLVLGALVAIRSDNPWTWAGFGLIAFAAVGALVAHFRRHGR